MSEWLFGPHTVTWKINRESVLLLGGRAALLMQIAHPLVAAGVANHSEFRTDPFGRLTRTLDTMHSIVFGDEETAARMMRRIEGIHGRVKGVAEDGRSYSAHDPTLAKWVFATLVYSSAAVYEACVENLTDDEKQTYFVESALIARMFGITGDLLPATYDGLMGWMKEMIASGEVEVTPLARELAAPILRPVPLLPRRIAESGALVTAALLPRAIREGYGLKLSRPRSALLAVGRTVSKRMLPLLPSPLRVIPAARAALAKA